MKITLASIIAVFIASKAFAATVQFTEVCPEGTPDSKTVSLTDRGETETLYVRNSAIASERDIQDAAFQKTEQGSGVSITFFPESAKRFDEAIKDLRGKRLAIIVDGKVVSAPTLATTQFSGKLQIVGAFSEEEARNLAASLSKAQAKQSANP